MKDHTMNDPAFVLEQRIDALILEVGELTHGELTDLLEAMCQRYQELPPEEKPAAPTP